MTEVDPVALLATVDAAPVPPTADTPPTSGPTKSKRPTTRAGRAARAATAAAKDAAPKATGGRPSSVALSVQAVHELGGAMVLPMLGLPMTGQILAATGKDAGALWAKLAKRYPAIERVFNATGDGALFAQLLMVYAPVIMAAVNEKKAGAALGGQAGAPDLGALFAAMGGAPSG